MEGSFDDDDLPLPRSQSVSPVSKPKLRRLKKADHSGPRDVPTADPVLSPSRVHPVAAPTMAATPASEESVPESHVMEPEMGQEPVLDPLFPDPARCEPNYMEIEREKQGFDWGGENGSAGVQEAKDVKSAKKRLNSEKEGETTRKYKKNKSGDKPKESAREKRRLEKVGLDLVIYASKVLYCRLIFDLLIHPGGQEREAELVRVHAESQRLYGYFNHPESTNDSTSNKVDICHDFDLTGPENGRGDDEHLEEVLP
ncbi:hypothetical protein B296_00022963 [Ensete ventricosum]|uniref:Uncharacterized protein n=1 Tax=Ensete ventricosum TaxID=4639 RepID=A0A427A0Y0_ENSVE|nr:hypothetical protein B296_00022963 [Ensete ventricosum]